MSSVLSFTMMCWKISINVQLLEIYLVRCPQELLFSICTEINMDRVMTIDIDELMNSLYFEHIIH